MMLDHYNMEFNSNETPVETLREGLFGEIHFRNRYFNVNYRWCNDSCREFSDYWVIFVYDFIVLIIYTVSIYKYGAKCGTSSKFWKIKVG